MTSKREKLLEGAKMELQGLAGEQGLEMQKLDELREDPRVTKYFELRENDDKGKEAIIFASQLPFEVQNALVWFNQERALLRQAAALLK